MMSEQQAPMGPDLRKEGFALTDLADGQMVSGVAGGEPVLLARCGSEIFATAAHCTHYSGPLADGVIVGTTVRCPWHHACFDLRSGEALRAPALNPIPCYDVEQRDGRIYVGAKRAERDPLAPVVTVKGTAPASVVIVGAGAAGSAAAEMLRRSGYAGPITMIDRDKDAPYDRPNLSKEYLAGDAQEEWIPLRPEGFYAERHIDIVSTAATAIDVQRKQVRLADGNSLGYGALLLATGAEPVRLDVPGSDLPHVHTLRSLADSRALIAASAKHKRVVVAGASFIGLEVAASLTKRKLSVTVVAPEKIPLERVLGNDIGTMIKTLHSQHGVTFRLGHKLKQIRPDSVVLDDDTEVPATLVVAGIGVRPRLDLPQQAGLTIDKGVIVDAYLRSSIPDIYAAGDIARWPDPHTGAAIRVEHWVVAQRQGQTAARNILGAQEKFEQVPFFWSAHYGGEAIVNYVGHAAQWDAVTVDGDVPNRDAVVQFRQGDTTRAVATINRDKDALQAEIALEHGDERALA